MTSQDLSADGSAYEADIQASFLLSGMDHDNLCKIEDLIRIATEQEYNEDRAKIHSSAYGELHLFSPLTLHAVDA